MNDKQKAYSDFVVRPYSAELYHYAMKHADKDFKYIRKERKNGKWRYYYDDDTAKGRATKNSPVISNKPTLNKNITAIKPVTNSNNALTKTDDGNSSATSSLKNSKHRPGFKKKDIPLIKDAKDGKTAIVKLDTPSSPTKSKAEKSTEPDTKNQGMEYGPAFKFKSIDEMPKKTSEMSADQDQKAVNPKYNPEESYYSTNCAYCSATYDLRRRGYDVEAKPATGAYDTDLAEIASWYGTGLDAFRGVSDASRSAYGRQECIDSVNTLLLEEGEGAYGNFIMYWTGGGGHSVVWTVENGTVMIRDTQLNTVDTYENYMKKYDAYMDSYWYLRTDNRELSPAILEVARRRGTNVG